MSHPKPVVIHWRKNGEDSEMDLRFTVESFYMNLGDFRLFIVGDKPSWATDKVCHIPFFHPYEKNKDANIIHACIFAATRLLLEGYGPSDEVLIASDDCILIGRHPGMLIMEEEAVSFWKNFPNRLATNSWWKRPYGSLIWGLERGLSAGSFDAHVPQWFSISAIINCLHAPIGERDLSAKTLMAHEHMKLAPNSDHVMANRVKMKTEVFAAHRGEIDAECGRSFVNWSDKTRTPELVSAIHNYLGAAGLVGNPFIASP